MVRLRLQQFGGGHVFNAENINGTIHFFDAQSGERYTSKDMTSMMKSIRTTQTRVVRTDNLRVSGRMTHFVRQAPNN